VGSVLIWRNRALITQALLADKLQEKLGFVRRPDRRPKKTKRSAKARVVLAPPDNALILTPPDEATRGGAESRSQTPGLLRFNRNDKRVHPEQFRHVQRETGLDPDLQRDLAVCRLDKQTAKLFYYSYRMLHVTNGPGIVDFACDYLELLAKQIGEPPKDLSRFWDHYYRRQYLSTLKELRRRIERQREFAKNDKTRRCIEKFFALLDSWGI